MKKCLIPLLVGCILFLTTACQKASPVELEEPIEQVPTAAELQAALEESDLREVVVYYKDMSGYLVPVSMDIPWEEGIAKATLRQMVSNEENDLTAARLGLLTTLPEGLEMDMDIVGQLAKVSLSEECLACEDAEEEINMVSSIVNTLTEFDTIEQVQILVNGEEQEKLTHGTDISQPIMRGSVNLESVDMELDDSANRVQVFFESESSGCMVPVTRTVFSNADVDTAVLELLKGPKEAGLLGCIPKGTGLISVKQQDGVVTINMSKQFKEIMDAADGGQAAVKALVLTCSQFPDVTEVKLQVEGQPFTLDQETFGRIDVVNTQEEALMTAAFLE